MVVGSTTNTFLKTSGNNGIWDGHVYSIQGYTQGAFVTARTTSTSNYIMFGLSTNPTGTSSYEGINYAWYPQNGGGLAIYESGSFVGNFGSYNTSTVLTITYDGINVTYWRDGVAQRIVTVNITSPLFFDSSFYFTNGTGLTNVGFGAMGRSGTSGSSGTSPAGSPAVIVLGAGTQSAVRECTGNIAGGYRSFAAGSNNYALGDRSFAGGGEGNHVCCGTPFSSIVGGIAQRIYYGTRMSFLGGGRNNRLSRGCQGSYFASGIVSGRYNSIAGSQGSDNFIGGGLSNLICNSYGATISGGQSGIINSSTFSTITGGVNNYSRYGSCNLVSGARNYQRFNYTSTIAGGWLHRSCYSNSSTIGGGGYNRIRGAGGCARAFADTIAGGCSNIIWGYGAIGGGCFNTIGGGCCNNIVSTFIRNNTIAGGCFNSISGTLGANFIGGGVFNAINGGGCNGILGSQFNTINSSYNAFAIGVSHCISSTSNLTCVNTLSKQAGSFAIPHPDPSKTAYKELVHSFVESPTAGDNIYRFTVRTLSCEASLKLPDYYKHLNTDTQVFITPKDNFGVAHGNIDTNQENINIKSNEDGLFNVLVIGTRKDKYAINAWRGVERHKQI